MSVNSLLNVPRNKEEWNRWSFSHAQDHIQIIQAIQQKKNLSLIQYQVDPIDFGNPLDFLKRHSQLHTDMNGALDLQSIDLSETDLEDPNKLQAWVYSNYQEHNNVHLTLGI